MLAMQRSDVPIAIEGGGVELRMREAGDAFYWGPGHAPERSRTVSTWTSRQPRRSRG